MDEKKMAEEFAHIYKAIGSNCMDLSATNKDLKKLADMQMSFIRHYNHHIDIFNKNVNLMNEQLHAFSKYAKRQNVAILAGIGGFLYLYKKIRKLEGTKKE